MYTINFTKVIEEMLICVSCAHKMLFVVAKDSKNKFCGKLIVFIFIAFFTIAFYYNPPCTNQITCQILKSGQRGRKVIRNYNFMAGFGCISYHCITHTTHKRLATTIMLRMSPL